MRERLDREPHDLEVHMEIKKLFGKAKDAADDVRDKAEDLAEKAIDVVEEKSGKTVPDAVKKAVDKIADDAPEPPTE